MYKHSRSKDGIKEINEKKNVGLVKNQNDTNEQISPQIRQLAT